MKLKPTKKKYRKVQSEYLREAFQSRNIVRINGGYKREGDDKITTIVNHKRMFLYGTLDDSYGHIRIYPADYDDIMSKQSGERDETGQQINKKIASVDFRKYYNVYTDINNLNPCFSYLTPTILTNYIAGVPQSKDVWVYTIRDNEIEIAIKGEYDDSEIQPKISFLRYQTKKSDYATVEEWRLSNLYEDPEDLYSNFKNKIDIYERYFADAAAFIAEIGKDRNFGFVLKEEM